MQYLQSNFKQLQMIKSQSLPTLSNNQPELLTRKQAAALLQINLSTLWSWTKAKKVPVWGCGGRIYYKYSEIMGIGLQQLN